MITKNNFKDVLQTLGFTAEGNIFQKSIGEAELKVDFDQEKMIYPEDKGLKVNRQDTCNFSHPENFVVFECVHRLLEKDYKPEHLELEPTWQVGRGASGGRADILVKDQENNPLLIIECKTPGDEFERAWRKTQQDGDQLFSYAQQIQQTQYLCLYTSSFIENQIRADQRIIAHRDNKKILEQEETLRSFDEANDVEERFAVWRDIYKLEYTEVGIFEDNIQPYQIGKNKYTLVDDTKAIDAAHKEGKYNEFRTILRTYNIARRENAFEVLVNLFLCKLVDEEDNKTDLKFYWKGIAYDNYFDFVDRLQDLYQKGMRRFLGEKISYISSEQIDAAFWAVRNRPDATKQQIQAYFRELKFFTHSAFSFIDTHNEELFNRNVKVLLEIVQMWQRLRLKTDDQNQFLGEMFELFLDDGIKQSKGQFFTPLPICKFIVASLPLAEKIATTPEPIKAIDYACGSGHFLNEYAHQIKPLVVEQNKDLNDYYDQITGIEKEDRLVKVAKVAAYMHGQGQIKILDADALAYHREIPLESFDVLVANPPFAVEGFLRTLSREEENRYQLSEFTRKNRDTTNVIQCFFLERIHHLMAPGGLVSVIFPSSILSNTNAVYTRTREILLQFFDLVGITKLGSGTFGKTGTNTVVLFLRRKVHRPESTDHYRNRVNEFFEGDYESAEYQDDSLIKAYCEHIEIPYEEYIKLFGQTSLKPLSNLLEYGIFKDYKQAFDQSTKIKNRKQSKRFQRQTEAEKDAELDSLFINDLHAIEKDKLRYFILAHEQAGKVLIVNPPNDTRVQKQFLGYEWSGAKGNEGIKYNGGETVNNIITPLFDPKDIDDNTKINTAIKRNFIGETINPLPEYCHYAKLTDMLDFSRTDFNKAISLNPKQQTDIINTDYEMKKLGEVVNIIRGVTYDKNEEAMTPTSKIILTADNITLDRTFALKKQIFLDNSVELDDEKRLIATDIFICFSSGSEKHVGKMAYIKHDTEYYAGGFMGILRNKDTNSLSKYLFELLNIDTYRNIIRNTCTGSNINNLSSTLEEIKIPLPPLEVQQQIVGECDAVDQETNRAHQTIIIIKRQIEKKVQAVVGDNYGIKKLGDIADIKSGGTPSKKNNAYWENGLIPWLRSEVCKETHIGKNIDYECITEEGLNNSSAKWLTSDTTLIALVGATKGKTAFLTFEATTNQNIAGIKSLSKDILDIYIFYCLKSLYNQIIQDLSQYDMLNLAQIENIKIPVPPLDIQQQLEAEVEQFEAEITQAQAVIDKATERKNAILTKYL